EDLEIVCHLGRASTVAVRRSAASQGARQIARRDVRPDQYVWRMRSSVSTLRSLAEAPRMPITVATLFAVITLEGAWLKYGDRAIAPGFVTNFAATFLAFLVALDWERRQRRTDEEKAEQQRQAEEEKLAE